MESPFRPCLCLWKEGNAFNKGTKALVMKKGKFLLTGTLEGKNRS